MLQWLGLLAQRPLGFLPPLAYVIASGERVCEKGVRMRRKKGQGII